MAAFVAMAVLVAGLAHAQFAGPPGAAATDPALDLAGYRLPDGSFPVLCLVHADLNEQPGVPDPSFCDACLLKVGCQLPNAKTEEPGRKQSGLRLRVAEPRSLPSGGRHRGWRPVRAPPFLTI